MGGKGQNYNLKSKSINKKTLVGGEQEEKVRGMTGCMSEGEGRGREGKAPTTPNTNTRESSRSRGSRRNAARSKAAGIHGDRAKWHWIKKLRDS